MNRPTLLRHTVLRHTVLSTALITLLTSASLVPLAQAEPLGSGALAPNFTLKSLKGENLRLSEYAGHVRTLLFTGKDCSLCGNAIQVLDALRPELQTYGYAGWAIDSSDTLDNPRHEMRRMKLNAPVLMDTEGRLAKRYWVESLPTLFLIDRDGRIREVWEGAATTHQAPIAASLRRIAEE